MQVFYNLWLLVVISLSLRLSWPVKCQCWGLSRLLKASQGLVSAWWLLILHTAQKSGETWRPFATRLHNYVFNLIKMQIGAFRTHRCWIQSLFFFSLIASFCQQNLKWMLKWWTACPLKQVCAGYLHDCIWVRHLFACFFKCTRCKNQYAFVCNCVVCSDYWKCCLLICSLYWSRAQVWPTAEAERSSVHHGRGKKEKNESYLELWVWL